MMRAMHAQLFAQLLFFKAAVTQLFLVGRVESASILHSFPNILPYQSSECKVPDIVLARVFHF